MADAISMAGLGIATASTVMCEAEIKAGALVPLLLPYKIEPVDAHAVFSAARARRPRSAPSSIFWFKNSNRSLEWMMKATETEMVCHPSSRRTRP
jgi:DNA-binding transcriptional LysR family regulator